VARLIILNDIKLEQIMVQMEIVVPGLALQKELEEMV
jgi:hypothetical protein